MTKMTREESIKKFREMWEWLAENWDITKNVYFNKLNAIQNMGEDNIPTDACFLCEYATQQSESYISRRCLVCPIKFISEGEEYLRPFSYCEKSGSPYSWLSLYLEHSESKDFDKIKQLCLKIANLPERKN